MREFSLWIHTTEAFFYVLSFLFLFLSIIFFIFIWLVGAQIDKIKFNFIDIKELETRGPELKIKKMFSPFCFLTLKTNLHGQRKVCFFRSLNFIFF
jgi:hypothetical protein